MFLFLLFAGGLIALLALCAAISLSRRARFIPASVRFVPLADSALTPRGRARLEKIRRTIESLGMKPWFSWQSEGTKAPSSGQAFADADHRVSLTLTSLGTGELGAETWSAEAALPDGTRILCTTHPRREWMPRAGVRTRILSLFAGPGAVLRGLREELEIGGVPNPLPADPHAAADAQFEQWRAAHLASGNLIPTEGGTLIDRRLSLLGTLSSFNPLQLRPDAARIAAILVCGIALPTRLVRTGQLVLVVLGWILVGLVPRLALGARGIAAVLLCGACVALLAPDANPGLAYLAMGAMVAAQYVLQIVVPPIMPPRAKAPRAPLRGFVLSAVAVFLFFGFYSFFAHRHELERTAPLTGLAASEQLEVIANGPATDLEADRVNALLPAVQGSPLVFAPRGNKIVADVEVDGSPMLFAASLREARALAGRWPDLRLQVLVDGKELPLDARAAEIDALLRDYPWKPLPSPPQRPPAEEPGKELARYEGLEPFLHGRALTWWQPDGRARKLDPSGIVSTAASVRVEPLPAGLHREPDATQRRLRVRFAHGSERSQPFFDVRLAVGDGPGRIAFAAWRDGLERLVRLDAMTLVPQLTGLPPLTTSLVHGGGSLWAVARADNPKGLLFELAPGAEPKLAMELGEDWATLIGSSGSALFVKTAKALLLVEPASGRSEEIYRVSEDAEDALVEARQSGDAVLLGSRKGGTKVLRGGRLWAPAGAAEAQCAALSPEGTLALGLTSPRVLRLVIEDGPARDLPLPAQACTLRWQ